MALGTIARVTDRGFGFIKQDGREGDLFFHASALQLGLDFNDLQTGQRVEFDVEPDPRGRGERAVNIRPA